MGIAQSTSQSVPAKPHCECIRPLTTKQQWRSRDRLPTPQQPQDTRSHVIACQILATTRQWGTIQLNDKSSEPHTHKTITCPVPRTQQLHDKGDGNEWRGPRDVGSISRGCLGTQIPFGQPEAVGKQFEVCGEKQMYTPSIIELMRCILLC